MIIIKRTFKKENNKWKKEKCAQFKKGHQKKKSDILYNNEKEQLKKYEEKGKKVMCDNLGYAEKEQVKRIIVFRS